MELLSASQKLTRIGKTPTQMVTMGTHCTSRISALSAYAATCYGAKLHRASVDEMCNTVFPAFTDPPKDVLAGAQTPKVLHLCRDQARLRAQDAP